MNFEDLLKEDEEITKPIVETAPIESVLNQYEKQVKEMAHFAQKFVVKTEEEAQTAVQIAGEAKRLNKRLDVIRKEITEPAREFVGRVNDTARVFTEKLGEVERCLKHKLDIYRIGLEVKQQEEIAAQETPVFVPEEAPPIRVKGATAFSKTSYRFEVVNLELVPRDLLIIDEKKVHNLIKAGIRDISGLKIIEEEKTFIKAR